MSDHTLFISDLHLEAGHPAMVRLFLDFLDNRATQAEALYILGDLFEVWVGDDDPSPHVIKVTAGLRQLSESGVPIYLMHGNRDFLLGEDFARASGCTLLPDPTSVDLYGTPTLLMHGDLLCTDDHTYMEFRATVRNPAVQQDFLAKSLAERTRIARAMREQSEATRSNRPEQITDVNQQAVAATLREHGVYQLIHGHTHRPAVHEFSLDGHPARRIVLGDWYQQGSVLCCSRSGCSLQELPLPAPAH